MELKIRRDRHTAERGVSQLCGYLEQLGEREGWLVVFDRRKGVSWSERILERVLEGPRGEVIHLFGA